MRTPHEVSKFPRSFTLAAIALSATAPFDADQRERAARVALIAEDYAQAKHHLEALTILEPDREIHQRRLEALKTKLSE